MSQTPYQALAYVVIIPLLGFLILSPTKVEGQEENNAFLSVSSVTDQSAKKRGERNRVKTASSDLLVFFPASFLWVTVHETGHLFFARLFGDDTARFSFYKNDEKGFSIGRFEYDKTKMGAWGNAAISIGGVGFSRGLAELSDIGIRKYPLPPLSQKLLSMTFILSRFDFPSYVFRNAFWAPRDHPQQDIEQFVFTISGDNDLARIGLYGSLLGLATLDLMLDWSRISTHFHVLRGKPYQRKTRYPEHHLSLQYSPSGLQLHLSF